MRYDDEAIADPHPKVLNLTSAMVLLEGSTRIWSFITSPHAGAPTSPVPTSASFLDIEPTLRWKRLVSGVFRTAEFDLLDCCSGRAPFHDNFFVALVVFVMLR